MSYRFTVINAYLAFMKESELLCTDSTALVVRLSGLRTGHVYPQDNPPVLIYVSFLGVDKT
jgi:hypothetical protein